VASETSTIQSLKAVDAWIDVINANINGGVRTAFKSTRLKFSGSNVDVTRAGTSTSLPLQFPEPGLTTANTVVDFTQGAITASTENSHLAIQGEGFFLLASPDLIAANGTLNAPGVATSRKFLLTRDGEFRTNQNGLLVHSSGYFLVIVQFAVVAGVTLLNYNAANNGLTSNIRAVYNNVDISTPATVATQAVRLTEFLTQQFQPGVLLADNVTLLTSSPDSLMQLTGKQSLEFSSLGSTVYDFGYTTDAAGNRTLEPSISLFANRTLSSVLGKSLEASNASMTQSVPELSLAQKLFSALTKVLQTKQTNVDGVLNLVR
jgi:flagellar hook protein FlgE